MEVVMGKIAQGTFGAFSGKVGNVIGGSVHGTDYIRIKPARVHNPKTDAQQRQRQRFAILNAQLRHMKPFLREGFKNTVSKSPWNRAVAYNAKNAFVGEYPNQILDFSLIRVSEGDLSRLWDAQVDVSVKGELSLTWLINDDEGSAQADDVLMLLAYCPELEDCRTIFGGAERTDGEHTISLPKSYSGKTLHVYTAFRSLKTGDIATSTYAGQHVAA